MRTPDDVELAEVVSKEDQLIFTKGLKALGASDAILEKIERLDSLAESGAKFLSTTLQLTHRYHVVTLVGMWEEMDAIKKTLSEDRAQTDPEKRLPLEERKLLYQLYIAMVEQTANGYKLTMQGAEAMVRMMMSAGKKFGGEKKGKPGWGPIKKVGEAPGAKAQG